MIRFVDEEPRRTSFILSLRLYAEFNAAPTRSVWEENISDHIGSVMNLQKRTKLSTHKS